MIRRRPVLPLSNYRSLGSLLKSWRSQTTWEFLYEGGAAIQNAWLVKICYLLLRAPLSYASCVITDWMFSKLSKQLLWRSLACFSSISILECASATPSAIFFSLRYSLGAALPFRDYSTVNARCCIYSWTFCIIFPSNYSTEGLRSLKLRKISLSNFSTNF